MYSLYAVKGSQPKMDPIKMETMESASASNKKSVINQMSTHVWNLFAKTNLFALCCVGAFLSLVRINSMVCFRFIFEWKIEKFGKLKEITSKWSVCINSNYEETA